MQTRGDVYGYVASLAGDPNRDWLEPEYFGPMCQVAYDTAIQYLEGTCSPYIERVVTVPAVPVGVDESDLVPYSTSTGTAQKVYPLSGLMKPRFIDFKPAGTPNNQYKPATELSVLPDTPPQVRAGSFDIRIRGDFKPRPLLDDDTIVELHPNAGHALAYSVMALIGAERPNQGWVDRFGSLAQNAWDEIAADLIRQQQHLTFRLGSPNRMSQGRGGWHWNLQGQMGYEWRAFGLYLKLI
jgi:hypothetical protein